MSFVTQLRAGLTGSEQTPLVHLGNIEVEQFWGKHVGALTLPSLTSPSAKFVVNRMDQLALFLANPDDYVLLKEPLDPDYASYLIKEGFAIPKVICPSANRPELNITESFLADEAGLRALSELVEKGATLMPFGVSHLEEELSKKTGLPLAGPASTVVEVVNSKILSRQLNEQLAIRAIPGSCVCTLEELKDALAQHEPILTAGGKLVVKDAFGVSGKGLTIVTSPDKAANVIKMWDRQLTSKPEGCIRVVVEQWIEKKLDINYQILIGKDGRVTFCGVRDAVTLNGVHQGHRIPSSLTSNQIEELQTAGAKLGPALYHLGYYGLVGIDAILSVDDVVYPNLEINARFNMSTYQNKLEEDLLGGKKTLAKQFPLKLSREVKFAEVEALLGSDIYRHATGTGFLINDFATVNAAAKAGGASWPGRLYGLIIGTSEDDVWQRNQRLTEKLGTLERAQS